MPKTGLSSSEWEDRLISYANKTFTFHHGQRPPSGSSIAKKILLIEKCPAHLTLGGKDLLIICQWNLLCDNWNLHCNNWNLHLHRRWDEKNENQRTSPNNTTSRIRTRWLLKSRLPVWRLLALRLRIQYLTHRMCLFCLICNTIHRTIHRFISLHIFLYHSLKHHHHHQFRQRRKKERNTCAGNVVIRKVMTNIKDSSFVRKFGVVKE